MPILLNDASCDLIAMDTAPERDSLGELPINSNSAYIRVGSNELYYVCKSRLECSPINISEEALTNFDRKMNPSNTARKLNKRELGELVGGNRIFSSVRDNIIPDHVHTPVTLHDEIRRASVRTHIRNFSFPTPDRLNGTIGEIVTQAHIDNTYQLCILFKAIEKELDITESEIASADLTVLESEVKYLKEQCHIVEGYRETDGDAANELVDHHNTVVPLLHENARRILQRCADIEESIAREKALRAQFWKKVYIGGGVTVGILAITAIAATAIILSAGTSAPAAGPAAAIATKALLGAGAAATAAAAPAAVPVTTAAIVSAVGGSTALGTAAVTVASTKKARATVATLGADGRTEMRDKASILEEQYMKAKAALQATLPPRESKVTAATGAIIAPVAVAAAKKPVVATVVVAAGGAGDRGVPQRRLVAATVFAPSSVGKMLSPPRGGEPLSQGIARTS